MNNILIRLKQNPNPEAEMPKAMNEYSVKKILVGLDLSDTSLNALHTAIAIGRKNNAELKLLHVVEPELNSPSHYRVRSSLSKANRDVLNVLAGVIDKSENVKSSLIIHEGNVVEKIFATSSSDDCDLIVLGSHGASGYREGFIGSNTYGALKSAQCPVLIMPPGPRFATFRSTLFPVRPVLGALMRCDVVSNYLDDEATIDVLGLSYLRIERDTAILDKMADEMKSNFETGKFIVNTKWGQGISIADDVLQFARLRKPELIVLTSSLDVVTKPNYIGPHTQKIVNVSSSPVLFIQATGMPVLV